MQAPTHVLAGVLIQESFSKVKIKWLRITLIAATGLFLHSVFDRIARLTYHPSAPDFRSLFWVGYHVIVLSGFIVSLYYFWKPHKLGIIFSILPDFDWVIIHTREALGITGFYSEPWIHKTIHWLVDRTPPFSYLQLLPDRTHVKDGVLLEVALVVILVTIILTGGKQKEK